MSLGFLILLLALRSSLSNLLQALRQVWLRGATMSRFSLPVATLAMFSLSLLLQDPTAALPVSLC